MSMRTPKNIVLIALCLGLSACGTQNRSVESVHQPVVSRTDYVFDVSAGYDGLAQNDASRLAGWFESLKLSYGDRISVDQGENGANSAAREAVANIAARYGLLLDASGPMTTGSVASGNIRVVVSRAKATVPGCPDWSRGSEPNFNSHNASNYGCATNSNFAAMIADPRDLIVGRGGETAIDAKLSNKAIKSFRDRRPTGDQDLKNESSKGN
jgi:pilus assembly protein CpaD